MPSALCTYYKASMAIFDNVRYITVSELLGAMNRTLETSFPQVHFQGEISEISRAASGHIYLCLKDEQGQVSAVIWRSTATQLRFELKPGLAVLCQGRPNVYPKSGRLQVVLQRILPAGAGLLQQKFLELKAKLEREGLFAVERKRTLPFLPRAVGVVTSASGAVIHDIMVRVKERMPCLPVYLVDVRVQGAGAAEEIAAGVKQLSDSGLVDVIIVARGGGSLEDLWAFNEEAVVRAIFAAAVPVVSGVGHEVDISLADLAADVRAPTPTAAAEMVVPRRADLLRFLEDQEARLRCTERWLGPLMQRVDELGLTLEKRIAMLLQEGRLRLAAADASLRAIQPLNLVALFAARLEAAGQRLGDVLREKLAVGRRRTEELEGRMKRAVSADRARQVQEQLEQRQQRLARAYQSALRVKRHQFEQCALRLEAVSPRRVLERGYAIVQHRGRVVRSARDVEEGSGLDVVFAEGGAAVRVEKRFFADERSEYHGEQDKDHD